MNLKDYSSDISMSQHIANDCMGVQPKSIISRINISQGNNGANTIEVGNISVESFIHKYPITNKAYIQLIRGYTSFPKNLRKIYESVAPEHVSPIYTYFTKLPIDTEQIFIARLEDVRPKTDGDITESMKKLGISKGNTLDPWFRNISAKRDKFTTFRSMGGDHGFMGEHQYQVKVGSNHEEIIVFWGMRSSIQSNPIYIILYTILKMGYIQKNKKKGHLDLIHPHNCSTASNYDCI